MTVRDLPPGIFAAVMATGIVSLATHLAGMSAVAWLLFGVNTILYGGLAAFLIARGWLYPEALGRDLRSHANAPGFFTVVAATAILGNQFVVLGRSTSVGVAFWYATLVIWAVLSYTVLPWLMEQDQKPPLESGINGGWLVVVVATQSVCVLGAVVVGRLPAGLGPFLALCFWLVGGMLYIWLISLIFYRILFLPLSPGQLTPPYWINMGAMAISTLAGCRVVGLADQAPLIAELLPFVKGMTLLFWTTATWWIPVLLTLGVWRHLRRGYSLGYDHGFWSAVFPLGMYSVATRSLVPALGLPFLTSLADLFVWVALVAWGLTAAGLVAHLVRIARAPSTGDRVRADTRL